MKEPVYEKGYPSYDAVNRDNDPEPERYYDWMLWKMRQEDNKSPTQQQLRELMMITAEECGEVTQVCCKILRRDELDEKRLNNLIEEIGDLQCMINLLKEYNILTDEQIDARVEVKRKKLEIWSELIT
jgi:NTP pyrophosphatase (non-canonical NTP hydrolase)